MKNSSLLRVGIREIILALAAMAASVGAAAAPLLTSQDFSQTQPLTLLSTMTVLGVDASGYSIKASSGVNASNGCILLQGGQVCAPVSQAGPNGAIQFNNNGSFGGSQNFTYDVTTSSVIISTNGPAALVVYSTNSASPSSAEVRLQRGGMNDSNTSWRMVNLSGEWFLQNWNSAFQGNFWATEIQDNPGISISLFENTNVPFFLVNDTMTVLGADASGYSIKASSGVNASNGCILVQGGQICGPPSGLLSGGVVGAVPIYTGSAALSPSAFITQVSTGVAIATTTTIGVIAKSTVTINCSSCSVNGPLEVNGVTISSNVLVNTKTAISVGTVFEAFTSTISVVVSSNGYTDEIGGSAPTFTGCGTSPTISAGANNMRGSLVMTATPSSTCTMTAAPPAPTNWQCTISGGGAGTAVFFQQSGKLTGACDNTTGLIACGVGTFMTWSCTGDN